MKTDAITKAAATEALGLNKDFSVRFRYAARCEYNAEFRAANFEEVCKIAEAFCRNELHRVIGDDEELEGDEVAFITEDWNGQSDVDYPDELEVDMREAGEPFSWAACELVKRLANEAQDHSADAALVILREYIVAARGLLKKEDAVSPDSEAVP